MMKISSLCCPVWQSPHVATKQFLKYGLWSEEMNCFYLISISLNSDMQLVITLFGQNFCENSCEISKARVSENHCTLVSGLPSSGVPNSLLTQMASGLSLYSLSCLPIRVKFCRTRGMDKQMNAMSALVMDKETNM